MEQGLTLPRSALKRLAWQWGLGLTAGLVFFYFARPGNSIASMLSFACVAAVILFTGGWYTSRYQYVYLSSAGIRGRGTIGFKWRQLTWAEQLVSKPSSLNGLQGHTFTSSSSGESVFIPTAILQSPSFKALVTNHAPENHTFHGLDLEPLNRED